MNFRISQNFSEKYYEGEGVLYPKILITEFKVNRYDYQSYLCVYESILYYIEKMNIDAALKDKFNQIVSMISQFESLTTININNFLEKGRSSSFNVYKEFKLNKKDRIKPINRMNLFDCIICSDDLCVEDLKKYDDGDYCVLLIREKKDYSEMNIFIPKKIFSEANNKIALVVDNKTNCMETDLSNNFLDLLTQLGDLEVNRIREPKNVFFEMSLYKGLHIEFIFALNKLCKAFRYLYTSYSFKSGKYQTFDELEVDKLIESAVVVTDRAYGVMKYQLGI